MSVPRESILGWDLGGAHIKAARMDSMGCVNAVVQWPCPLWLGLDRLGQGIDHVIEQIGAVPESKHAVTMTGELVDLFPDRVTGVRQLIAVMTEHFADKQMAVYAGTSGFLNPDGAIMASSQVASANWHASASLAARHLPEGLLVDIGSTTTDLIPFSANAVLATGYSDHQRLSQEELLYTGVVRTPLMAVARRVPFHGDWTSLMAEHFATTADIYRLTGELPQGVDLLPSADNGEKTEAGSARRLARMLGLDVDAAGMDEWRCVARFMAEQQLRSLADACERVFSRVELSGAAPLVGAGVGRFLIRKLSKRLDRPYIGFDQFFTCTERMKIKVAECAPAVAVASLARAAAI